MVLFWLIAWNAIVSPRIYNCDKWEPVFTVVYRLEKKNIKKYKHTKKYKHFVIFAVFVFFCWRLVNFWKKSLHRWFWGRSHIWNPSFVLLHVFVLCTARFTDRIVYSTHICVPNCSPWIHINCENSHYSRLAILLQLFSPRTNQHTRIFKHNSNSISHFQ